MTRYRSNHECSVCHEHMVWDSEKQTLTCRCGTLRCTFVNQREFVPIPCDKKGGG
ncbi:MAG: hypothetical protein NWE99_10845 [Candidatus Bathyarchaeota archaeon]|nr:hypothetical protein [Candidatus Bathyarchaeota archaeon]